MKFCVAIVKRGGNSQYLAAVLQRVLFNIQFKVESVIRNHELREENIFGSEVFHFIESFVFRSIEDVGAVIRQIDESSHSFVVKQRQFRVWTKREPGNQQFGFSGG